MHPWRFSPFVSIGGLILILATAVAPAAAQNAPLLRYGFQAGRQCAYEVKIEAELEDEIETREGVLTYTALSATDKDAVVKCSGSLASHTRPKPGRNVIHVGPPRIGPPPFFGGPQFGPSGPEGITINRRGEVILSKPLTHLPFLLGDQETLMIEEFPADARAAWTKERDVAVQERKSSGFPPMMFGPRGGGSASQRPAKERLEYAVVESRPDAIRVTKKYSLRTGEEGGTSRFDMSGSGEFAFDPKEGLIKSLAMKYQIRVNEPNLTLTVPVSVACRLLTPAEMAEREKRAQEQRAAIAKANAPKPFEPGERANLLKDLRSKDEGRMQAAADRLVKAPVDDKPADFAKALAPLLAHSNDWVKGAAAKALITWVAPEAEDALTEATTSENLWVRRAAIEALGKLPSEKAAEAVAAQMYRDRGEAAKALKAMGPIAEAAAIGCLKDRDDWVRKETCQVLSEIGGEESLKALRQYGQRQQGARDRRTRGDQADANKAIAAIEQRLEENKDKPTAAKPKKARRAVAEDAPPALRTWRDASGLFEVEAALASVQDGKVTLKKKDGRTIVVPLEKLSKADRTYLEEHAQSSKPANPFD